ncbi:Arginine-binding periplasmic protein [Saliniradius amylolyticus]|uniref:Arginine-binding periplasmic protein n=1 Tax=Saliniradius amylolyticus TaxID=2183582 RepID=A0A2S2E0L2_9ALTE|nr:transporter substrate-binding domain-containing protein [Saliniradius amylolyticus]AWL11174.1 Arginine-binding periplasmic protein [Saliniradius amylolyticus]
MKQAIQWVLALVCLSLSLSSQAQTEELVIGTKVAPPFVIKDDNGDLSGISIELWQQAATELGLKYRFEETDLEGLLDGLKQGRFDASVAALTVNAKREAEVDFTHPFYTTGLAIAVPKGDSAALAAVKGLFSWEFFAALGGLCGLLLLVGFILWLFERKKNTEMFGGSAAEGIGASFWWAAVTMTTVGYGDKAPTTLGGRIVGFIWMFAAIILISSFTAAIATSLTVSKLETSVQGVKDLPNVKVVTLANSASAHYLERKGVGHVRRSSLDEALTPMTQGQFDALVYDKPILQYVTKEHYPGQVQILPEVIERQDYAIALPEKSLLREPLNYKLLEIIARDDWQVTLQRYLGDDAR